MSVCGCIVSSVGNRNRESWGLLVEEHISKIAKLRNPSFFISSVIFWILICLVQFSGSVLTKKPKVQSGEGL